VAHDLVGEPVSTSPDHALGTLSLMRFHRALAIGFASSLVMALYGCGGIPEPTPEPSFYRSMAQPGAQLDSAAAASMFSGYRKNNGLGALTVDPTLTRLAEQQARAMARRDKLDHNAGGPFAQRMKSGGYIYKAGAENIGAGYHTLAEAFSGWRDSPPHRANMLAKGVTQMGIAAVYDPNTKYKVFWTMILAAPADNVAESASSLAPAQMVAR
jgi:uncharacterized protein YkwD